MLRKRSFLRAPSDRIALFMAPQIDTETSEILTQLNELDVAELREVAFCIGGSGPTPHPPYDYQLEAIRRVEAGLSKDPPVSGILHYPTGAGKTRTALELIARGLKENPDHRFVWATASRNLIRQSMVRMVELSQIFPEETANASFRRRSPATKSRSAPCVGHSRRASGRPS